VGKGNSVAVAAGRGGERRLITNDRVHQVRTSLFCKKKKKKVRTSLRWAGHRPARSI
jgi:hypothetical protein